MGYLRDGIDDIKVSQAGGEAGDQRLAPVEIFPEHSADPRAGAGLRGV
ncbi:hypothetical protein ACVOMV_08295 [Mesorhizobium atlanticum]